MATLKFARTWAAIEKLPESNQERARTIMKKFEFMDRQLDKLQAQIKRTGWTEVYQNGQNQSGMKKSAAGEAYNSLMKNYMTAVRQLEDILADVTDGIDELEQRFFK
jgi:esterase/lipase